MKTASLVFLCTTLVGARSTRALDWTDLEDNPAAPPVEPTQAKQPPSAEPAEQPPPPPSQPPPLRVEHQAAGEAAALAVRGTQEAPAESPWVYTLGNVTVSLPTPTQQPARVGQWVYTAQYSWVYMPYGDQYVSDGTATDSNPYEYAYCPGQGWTWLSAPWVIGWGPYPYYGTLGAGNYAWVHGRQGRTLRLQRYDGTPSDGYTSFGGPDRRANQPSYSGALRGPRAWAGYGGNASSASVGYAGSNRGSVSGAPDGRHGCGGTVRPTGGAGGDSASSRGYRGASSLGGGSMGGGRSSGTTSHWGGYGGASSQGGGASTGRSGARSAGPR